MCFAQVVSPLGCSSMPSTCYWNTTCSERTDPHLLSPAQRSLHERTVHANILSATEPFAYPHCTVHLLSRVPARSLRTDPQWRHSQIYGDSKFWAPFDIEAASYNFGASDHYVPAVAMADAVGKEPFANIAGKFGANLNGIWELLTGSGLAAAIVNITNVGGHEGLNVQIEKGVYGADAEVMARCEATSMHPGSNAAGTLAPAQRHPVVYHRSGSIDSTTRAGGRTCRSVTGCALCCSSSTRLRLVVFFYFV